MINPGMMVSDRYEIVDRVGSGGMADVYKAKDHRLNRFIAIKILKQGRNRGGRKGPPNPPSAERFFPFRPGAAAPD